MVTGIGLVNLIWCECKQKQSIPVGYQIYNKDMNVKTKNII